MANANEITKCSLCLKAYQESGDLVPLILPCLHTFCKKCVKDQMERDNTEIKKRLKCQECGQLHLVVNGISTFPTNLYVIPQIRKDVSASKSDVCRKHGRVATFFCKDNCQTPICDRCVVNEHKAHDFVLMSDENKELSEILIEDVDNLIDELQKKRAKLLGAKQEVCRHDLSCLSKLTTNKLVIVREITEKFDEKINLVNLHKNTTRRQIDEEVKALDKKLSEMKKMKELSSNPASSRQELAALLYSVACVAGETHPGVRVPEYHAYNEDKVLEAAEVLCGHVSPTIKQGETTSLITVSALLQEDQDRNQPATCGEQNKSLELKRQMTSTVPVQLGEPPAKKTALPDDVTEKKVVQGVVLNNSLLKDTHNAGNQQGSKIAISAQNRTVSARVLNTPHTQSTTYQICRVIQAGEKTSGTASAVTEPAKAVSVRNKQSVLILQKNLPSPDLPKQSSPRKIANTWTARGVNDQPKILASKILQLQSLHHRPLMSPKVQYPAQRRGTVVKTITTKYENINDMIAHGDNSVFVASTETDIFTKSNLTQYSLANGEKLRTMRGQAPWGMAVVTVDEKSYLSISEQDKMKIKFYDITNLNEERSAPSMSPEFYDPMLDKKAALSYSVAPSWPSRLWASSPTVLWYVDDSKSPRTLRSLNCSTLPPKHIAGTNGISTQRKDVWDIITTRHGVEQLAIVAHGIDQRVVEEEVDEATLMKKAAFKKIGSEVCAYNAERGLLKWRIRGNLSGMEKEMCAEAIASDGRGHVFMCDTNNSCIQMFSTDGRYLGPLLRDGEQGLGKPKLVRWQNNSLIIAHKKDQRNKKITETYRVSRLNLS